MRVISELAGRGAEIKGSRLRRGDQIVGSEGSNLNVTESIRMRDGNRYIEAERHDGTVFFETSPKKRFSRSKT